MRAQEPFERILNGFLLPLDVAAQAGQRHAGVIGYAPVGQNLARQVAQQAPEIADVARPAREAREALGRGGKQGLRIGRAVQQGKYIEDFLGLQASPLDVQLLNRYFDVRQAAEIDADGGPASGGLRPPRRAQVLHRLARLGQVFIQPRAVAVGRDFFQLAPPHGAVQIAPHHLPQGFVFEDVSAGCQGSPGHGCGAGCHPARRLSTGAGGSIPQAAGAG